MSRVGSIIVVGAVALLAAIPTVPPSSAAPVPRLAAQPPPSPPPPAPGGPFVTYFAEGTTQPGFSLLYTLVNHNRDTATVDFYFFFDTGARHVIRFPIAPGVLRGLLPEDVVGPGRDFGAVVVSDRKLSVARTQFVERRISESVAVSAFASSAGVTSLAWDWHLAEGSTLRGFQEYLTILNPASFSTDVDVTYGLEGQPGQVRRHSVPPGRTTINVNAPSEAGPDQVGVAVKVVTSSAAILVERPMYFVRQFDAGHVVGGAHVAAATAPQKSVFFAEGNVLPGWFEFLTLFNPASVDQQVSVDYLIEGGAPIARSYSVPAGSRRTIQVYSDGEGIGRAAVQHGSGGVAMAVSTSGPGIVSERPLYVDSFMAGILLNEGDVVVGSTEPITCAGYGFGSTVGVDRTYLTLVNSADSTAVVEVVSYGTTGRRDDRPVLELPPRRRVTYEPNAARDEIFGLVIRSVNGGAFVSEVALYLESGPGDEPVFAADVLTASDCAAARE